MKETATHAFWTTQPVPQSTQDQQQPNTSNPFFLLTSTPNTNNQSSTSSSSSTTTLPFIQPILISTTETTTNPQSTNHNNNNNNSNHDYMTTPPTPLPSLDYEWKTIDFFSQNNNNHHNNDHLNQVFQLLRDHYVEDDDEQFRFAYPESFLEWALSAPNSRPEWCLGLYVRSSSLSLSGEQEDELVDINIEQQKKLIGFISGIPQTIQFQVRPTEATTTTTANDEIQSTQVGEVMEKKLVMPMCNVNFLCVNKAYRNKGLAPLLIRELRRRCAVHGQYQIGVYTSGTLLPTPVSSATYYIRDLNVRKLIEIDYSRVPYSVLVQARELIMSRSRNRGGAKDNDAGCAVNEHEVAISLYESVMRLPNETSQPYVTFNPEKHTDALQVLLDHYLEQFQLSPVFTRDEVKHWFTSRPNVNYTFVQESDSNDGELLSVISFFVIPSSVIECEKYDNMKTAYNFYSFSRECLSGGSDELNDESTYVSRRIQLVRDTLILARNQGCDCFHMLNIQNNIDSRVTKELNFGVGFGHLNYYLFGVKCTKLDPKQIGLVML